MARSRRYLSGQIGFLTLLASAGGVQAADAVKLVPLPALRVDPALLGLPPAPSAPVPTAPVDSVPAEAAAKVSQPEAALPAPTAPTTQAVTAPAAVEPLAPQPEPVPAPAIATPADPVAPAAAAASVPTDPDQLPVHLVADSIGGVTSVETTAAGNVVMQRGERNLKADQLVYREPLDEVEATGNVRLLSPGESISGPHLKIKLGENVGSFDSPSYTLTRLETGDGPLAAHGNATRLDFQGEDKYQMADATYSTCPVGNTAPDWFARITDLKLDYTTSQGVGKGATVVFKGVPIMYLPWMSFSLDNQRKTGLLSPTIGSSSKSGIEVITPVYLNIAPNMDATVAPRYMSKRGTQWAGEYRYLGESYVGSIAGEYLENDKITQTNRNALTMKHEQNFGYGFTGSLNLNKVSDDTYFTDLSTRLANVAQTNLLREGRINYSGGGWWSASLMAQRYQTLQDPSLPPVAIPYDRLPQLLVNAARPDMPFGTEVRFMGEYVDFNSPTGGVPEGARTTLYPQIAYPMQTAAFYVTPKVGFHATRYDLTQEGMPDRQLSRNVPIFSVDGGVTFERPLELLGKSYTQTLEPRAYYLRVPTRDQNPIPIFDSGVADFNFAQIFSENAYTGGDRISDANQLTVAATSRIIDTESGEELLRGALGQRYYFSEQSVTIPGVAPRTRHIADVLAALSGKINRELSIDSGVQYNPQDSQIERLNAGMSYQPERGKVFNASYRYTRELLRQIDTSAQWPLFGGWHAVGRYNYSLRDRRLVEAIAGLEYDGGCWAARFVTQRLATAVGQVNNSIFVQLELNGFSKIGSNPLNLLKRNIPGYGHITGTPSDPVFAD